jgi:predicted nuclease with TOPRIM domain
MKNLIIRRYLVIFFNIVKLNMTKEDREFLKKQFKEEREYFDRNFKEMEKRLDDLNGWTIVADKKFKLIEKKFSEVDEHFDKIEKYITNRFADLEEKIDVFFEEMDTIRKISQLHTIKIGRIETGYNLKDK